MSTDQVKTIVKKYIDLLREKDISFSHVYLYGSYATGKNTPESDIDIAVVVKELNENEPRIDKQMTLWKLTPKVDMRIEPIVLEEKDFKEGYASIMANQVKKYGILID